jgi:Zn-dependent peptidase ImmA (M78 family)/DNA-binding XRE family transcriptional regulator
MAQSVKAPVTPDVLVWARESASVTQEDAAKAAGVALDRLQGWERGEDSPTLPMLRKLAERYKRPLAVLLLSERPTDFMPLRDFRRVDPAIQPMPALVAYEIRLAQERREIALELMEETGAAAPSFSLKARVDEDPEAAGTRLRRYFDVTPETQLSWARKSKVFEGWRSAFEAKGVLVFVMGGAHAPPVRHVRGFAIPSEIMPVITVNGRDRTNGRTFTALHECAHLMLGEGVVENDISTYRNLPAADRAVEKFCNAVAASALIPKDIIAAKATSLGKNRTSEWTDSEISATADEFGVSREAVILRATNLGFASRRFYARKRVEFEKEYEELDKPSTTSTPIPPHKTMLGRYGRSFARLVLNGYHERRITMNDAAAFLGVQAKHIAYVEQQAFRGV